MLANPFSAVKVRGAARAASIDATRAFTESEWRLIRVIADGLEYSYGWSAPEAQRLQFLLDFGVATGLRAGVFVGTRLRQIETDPSGLHWLRITGKGSNKGRQSRPAAAGLERADDLFARPRTSCFPGTLESQYAVGRPFGRGHEASH